jgi:hypothetical protein
MMFPRRENATNDELILTIIEIQGWLSRYGRQHTNWHETLNEVINRLEKQKAISELQPPTDDWETYADRLYDLAYLSGYNDGLVAKRGGE